MRSSVIVLLLASPLACQREAPAPAPMGQDCATLADAARRASACDPALDELANGLAARHDEGRCRHAARQLLANSEPSTAIRSVFEQPPHGGGQPLTADERSALLNIQLPAQVTVVPDIAPGPGVPPTSAALGERGLDADARGRLRAWIPAGSHTLQLRHAGEDAVYCVDVDPCAKIALTAHGSRLAEHASVRTHACDADPPKAVAQRPGG